jgi:hypothetical protein
MAKTLRLRSARTPHQRISDHRLSCSIARLRKALEKELAELDRLISDHMRRSIVWVEKEKLLASARVCRGIV